MSLFKTCDWWEHEAATSDTTDTYDVHSLVVDSLAGEGEEQHMQVVLVSMAGLLQIYQPTHREGGQARAEDLLLEQQLGLPVCQVDSGLLVAGQSGKQLAILHPRKLSVYQLSRRQGSGSQGDSYVLSLAYQHNLLRSAYAITKGPFGGIKGKDYLAVISLDGTLSIFEQETHTFSRFIPGFLVPGPLAFVDRSDSFIISNSSFCLDSFKYQTLAVAGDGGSERHESQDISHGKKIVPDWSFGVGEPILQIQVIRSMDKDEPATIVALARQTVFAILDTGGIVWAKRLEFTPRCIISFGSMMYDKRIISLISSDSGTLMIYDNTNLKWASQLQSKPISVKRGKFWDKESSQTREGLLVTLTEDGHVSVNYLGTHPTLFTAAPPDSREVNYEETDAELAKLSAIIKQSQSSVGQQSVANETPGLRIDINVNSQLEMCRYAECRLLDTEAAVPMVGVTIALHTASPLTKVRVNVSVVSPIAVSKPAVSFTSLTSSDTVQLHAYLTDSHIVSSLQLGVVVTYITHQGVPHCVQKSVQLPLSLAIKPCPPIKDADFKVTLSTNKPAVSLLELFPEFVLDSSMTNAAGFQQYGGPVITVLSSKTSQRYRLQSENLPAIWMITEQVKKRLEQKFMRSDGKSDLECSYASSLPLQEFFNEIDSYFMKRKQYKSSLDTLTQRMAQFRAIERRLLTRFKDKTPTPLTNLDMLLEGTFKQVQASCDQVEAVSIDEQKCASNLGCIIRLLLLLAKLSSNISNEDFEKLEAALSPVVHIGQEQGWQETTDAALTFILRTSLAKPGRENQGATPITLETAKETTRVKKHVSSVMERLTKGGNLADITLVPDQSPFVGDITNTQIFEKSDEDSNIEIVGKKIESHLENAFQEPTPLGSKFGESGERIRSARIRSARSARSRPVSAVSNWNDDAKDDIPPDGPVDLDELDNNTPITISPIIHQMNTTDIKIQKGIESPLDIFPSTAPVSEEDIW